MHFLFLDESGDTRKPSEKKDPDNPGHFFSLGGFLIHENDLREIENYIERIKRNIFGDEHYEKYHPELKAMDLFSRKYINNRQRQNLVNLISDKIKFFHDKGILFVFCVIFDKRKAKIYDDTDEKHIIDLWYYGLGVQKLLLPVSHCIETKYASTNCAIIMDRIFAEKALSESIVKYFCGNPSGKNMTYMYRHPLFGVSKNSPLLQVADFITGSIRFWEEYEDNYFYEKRKLRKSKLPLANSRIRKSEYYCAADEGGKSVRGIIYAFD